MIREPKPPPGVPICPNIAASVTSSSVSVHHIAGAEFPSLPSAFAIRRHQFSEFDYLRFRYASISAAQAALFGVLSLLPVRYSQTADTRWCIFQGTLYRVCLVHQGMRNP